MAEHRQEDLDRLGKLARARFTTTLMSDTKWRKVLAVLAGGPFASAATRVKWIDADSVVEVGSAIAWGLHPPHGWAEVQGQPVELRAIEWLEVHSAPEARVALEQALCGIGQLDIEHTALGLRIMGYRGAKTSEGAMS